MNFQQKPTEGKENPGFLEIFTHASSFETPKNDRSSQRREYPQ